MKEIKIVTSFFDIGRGDYETWQRSTDTYFEYFRFWTRIQNELIVYCDPQNVNRILKIREEFGLGDRTTVIPVVLEEIEPEILARMRMAEQDKEFQNFRYLKKDPSNIALYDYVMLLKWWCMADAAKNLIETYQLAWVDFGFNHGGSLYIKSEDFDFCWSYDYPYKLSAFCLNDPDKMVLIDSLQFQHDCFTGCSFVIPAGLCATFWTYMKEAMCSLLDLNCIDDDQQLMLMVYKKHKELFYIQIANWFDMFRLNSNQNFTIKQKKQGEFVQNQAVQVSLMRRCWRKLKHLFKKKEEKEMQRLDPFIERMLEKKRKYYG